MVYYSIPPTCRFRAQQTLRLFPSSNRLKSTLAILQFFFSSFQAYMEYDPLIRCQGLSSPFLIAVPFLYYMTLLNLLANLVQGSYTHVIIIPPVPNTDTIHSTVQSPIPIQSGPQGRAISLSLTMDAAVNSSLRIVLTLPDKLLTKNTYSTKHRTLREKHATRTIPMDSSLGFALAFHKSNSR